MTLTKRSVLIGQYESHDAIWSSCSVLTLFNSREPRDIHLFLYIVKIENYKEALFYKVQSTFY